MSLSLNRYIAGYEKCLGKAELCYGDAAAIWREIAESYRFLIMLERQQDQSSLHRSGLANAD
jgi:hypothetical protein